MADGSSKDNPHVYGKKTRLSTAYTDGRDGKPCAKYNSQKGTAAYKAWKRGHDEFTEAKKAKPE